VTANAREIFSLALALPEPERRALVAALSDSFEEPAVELPEGWREEISGRIAQLERGEVEPIEWSEVEARIQRILSRR
jgi:putative addiction module component (TIGR02574 family)